MLHGLPGADPTAVHQTRVASRRLRELLPVLQLGGDVDGKLSRRLRKVTRALGPVREADVLIALIDDLAGRERQDQQALARVADSVRAERARALPRATGRTAMAEFRRVARRLAETGDALESGEARVRKGRGWRWALEARVARRAGTLAAAMNGAGAVYLPERLHAVRIALKKLRYALELSGEAHGQKRTADLRTLKRAQELLGGMHDLQMLIDRVRQVQASLTPPDPAVRRQLDRLVRTLEDECRRLHARYMRHRPALRALCDRLAARPPATARRAG